MQGGRRRYDISYRVVDDCEEAFLNLIASFNVSPGRSCMGVTTPWRVKNQSWYPGFETFITTGVSDGTSTLNRAFVNPLPVKDRRGSVVLRNSTFASSGSPISHYLPRCRQALRLSHLMSNLMSQSYLFPTDRPQAVFRGNRREDKVAGSHLRVSPLTQSSGHMTLLHFLFDRGLSADRNGFRVDHRESGSVSVWEADRELSGTGAVGGLEWKSATAGTYHETRELSIT